MDNFKKTVRKWGRTRAISVHKFHFFHNFSAKQWNRLRISPENASAQFLDFLELAGNYGFLERKLIRALKIAVDGR